MECKLPIKKMKGVRTSRQNIRIPIIPHIEMDTPEYGHISESWKSFGKWLVVIEESKIKDNVKVSQSGTKNNHVCIVLRSIGFTLYFYELIDNYKEEHLDIFNHMRLVLDRVLVTNQITSKKLRFYLETFENWHGDIFPRFLRDYDNKKISKWSETIDNDIEKWSNTKFSYTEMDRKKYWKKIIKPDNWDIKGCYAELLSILNTIKPELPQENIMIIDDLIARCEHGYYIGFLTGKAIEEYQERYPQTLHDAQSTRDDAFLLNKLKNFRKGREDRVLKASEISFGLTDEVKKKLNRMFEFKKVK